MTDRMDADTPRTQAMQHPHRRQGVGFSPHWMIWLLIPGAVLWWALGLSVAASPVLLVPMLLRLTLTRVRIPPRFGVWLLFLGITFVTTLQLPPRGMANFLLLRGSEYLAVTLAALLVYNVAPRRGDEAWVRRAFVWAWIVLVLLGLLSLAIPSGSLPSLAQTVLPQSLLADNYIQELTTPTLAQVQNFLGFDLARPSAPYTYANHWGGAFALMLPFVISTAIDRKARLQRLSRIFLVISVVPAVLSLNRAMWGGMIAALAFLVVTTKEPVLRRALQRAAVAIALVLAVASITPLGQLVATRIQTPHSNSARADLASQAVQRTLERPLIGYGGPVEYDGPGIRPPVGTQGQLWLVLVSSGIPAALVFIAYFVLVFPLLRGRQTGQWTRATLVTMFVQLPFYSMLGGQLMIVMVAVAAAQREVDGRPSLAGVRSHASPVRAATLA